MLAFFGLGTQEILLLAIVGLLPIVILVIILGATRRSGGRTRELEDENRRLRDELDRGRDRPASSS
jgi:hypothetical protein